MDERLIPAIATQDDGRSRAARDETARNPRRDRRFSSATDPATASTGQGPGCSSSSQPRACGAEPAIGSARRREAVAQRNVAEGSLKPTTATPASSSRRARSSPRSPAVR